jgi:hypothetical protein
MMMNLMNLMNRKNNGLLSKEGGISYKFIKFITLVGGFSTKTRRKCGDELDELKLSSSIYYHLKVVTIFKINILKNYISILLVANFFDM